MLIIFISALSLFTAIRSPLLHAYIRFSFVVFFFFLILSICISCNLLRSLGYHSSTYSVHYFHQVILFILYFSPVPCINLVLYNCMLV